MSDLAQLQSELLAAIIAAESLAALETMRVAALGKQGSVSALLKTMGSMSPDERQLQGPIIYGLRETVTAALVEKKAALETTSLNVRLATERLDMTLPAPAFPQGSVHPVSQVMDEHAFEKILDIAVQMSQLSIFTQHLYVDSLQFLVYRLHFLLRGFQFLIGGLEFFVDRLIFFI